ncbi:MAG: hypothetical protein ACT452_18835 [Microthrixaceae bacterium]
MGIVRGHRVVGVVAIAAILGAGAGGGSAAADPVATGSASAFALQVAANGTDVIAPMPVAATAAPAAGETVETVIDIPASPLAVSGTLIARSAVHEASDLASELVQSDQTLAGPYNARAIGQIEGLNVLIDEAIPGGALIHADVLRAEAVAVCTAGQVSYSAESEVVNLQIAGDDSLSGPINDLVDEITAGINASPLAQLVTVEVNVLTITPTGAAVDALVVKLLPAGTGAEATPLVLGRFGHAEVANVGCAPAAPAPTVLDSVTAAAPQSDPLPRTGGTNPAGVAAGLGVGALAMLALRRRFV